MKKFQAQWSRRKFLVSAAGIGATAFLNPAKSRAIDEVDPRVARIVAESMGIDTHNHIDVPFAANELPAPNIDLTSEMKLSGLSAVCITFSVDRPKLVNPGDAYERFKNGLASIDQILIQNGVKRSLNMADLRTAHKKHQPTVIQSVEGGHFLEGRVERLEEAYHRGLRHLGLLHDNDAIVPLGDVYTNQARFGGLTAFGAEVIRECNRLGILIDLAHANTETVAAALKLAVHPVIISHTGLDTQLGQNPSRANMMKPRLISREQAKLVAETGGVIGVWTHLAESPLEYAQNVRALVDIVGVDHVCIGTDTKLAKSSKPQGAPGAGQINERIGERTNLAWKDQKIGFYYAVVDAMLKTGFSPGEIAKIGSGNFCRVFDAATSKRR